MNLHKKARLVERRAISVSKRLLDGKRLESFDPDLLITADSDLNEHVDMQSGGQLYFGMLCRMALEKLNDARNSFDNWKSKVYNKCNEKIKKETGIKRPNKVDVENRIMADHSKKVLHFKKVVLRREYVYERLEIWYSSWITKGFSISDLKSRKRRNKDWKKKNRRGLFSRRTKNVKKEEE